jgi:LuxR family maltose regulon positive regulatory protein
MAERIAEKPPVSRRRIIERPRLTRLLDESSARIKMLVAPAGYGKTTLARQWLAARPQSGGWVTVDASSVDVAALARDVQTAVAELIPRGGSALIERLAVTADAARESETLAEILAADLREWDGDHWLVIDDYHLIAGAIASERFIESLLLRSSANLLLLSRQRPSWASARRILYGEMFEVERQALAMNLEEAGRLLDAEAGSVSRFVDVTGGWPAVLSLAAITTLTSTLAESSSLYRFFAEELYQRITPELRWPLSRIALVDVSSRETLERFLGDDAQPAINAGVSEGFLTEAESGHLELHPLLRSFLLDKLRAAPHESVSSAVRDALRHLVDEGLWEEALDVADKFGGGSLLPELDEHSVDRLLQSGRTTTLRRWLERSSEAREAPALRLAAAELAFREGHYYESETIAEVASRSLERGSEAATRAMMLAARAAHAASREQRAISLYQEARASTESPELERIAALGELAAAVELESPDAMRLYEELGPAERLEPHERVMYVARGLNLQTRFGLRPELDLARSVSQLLYLVDDPVARSSFRNVFAYTLASSGAYDEAMSVIDQQLDDADRCRLDFVVPYAECIQAVVHCARRDYTLAEQLLDTAERRSRQAGDLTAQYISAAIRIRTLVAQGAAAAAIRRPVIAGDEITQSLRAELLASLALAHAVAGADDQGLELADAAEKMSIAPETAIMVPLARGIIASRRGDVDEAKAQIQQVVGRVAESGLIECLICAFRASPELFISSIRDEQTHRTIADAMYVAGDEFQISSVEGAQGGVVASLSPREKDVLALLGHGLSNREIGARLFISPATVKVHVKHIFEKLGVRSRTAAALRASQLARD